MGTCCTQFLCLHTQQQVWKTFFGVEVEDLRVQGKEL